MAEAKKDISTLVEDIYSLFQKGRKNIDDGAIQAFGHAVASLVSRRLSGEEYEPRLRLSNLGSPCRKKLWYSINRADRGEPLSPQVRFKFLYGDLIELVVLFLARLAGHKVEREQEEVNLHGVEGHLDAFIDDTLTDVKSATTAGMEKFRNNALRKDDPFGYLVQLGTYGASTGEDKGAFLAVDKSLGELVLDSYTFDKVDWKREIDQTREMLAQKEPPKRGHMDRAILTGKKPNRKPNGNRELDIPCQYCAFKWDCWPGLKKFIYKGKAPVHMTFIGGRYPKVLEVDRFDNPIGGEVEEDET